MKKLLIMLMAFLFIPQVFAQEVTGICPEKKENIFKRLAQDFDKTVNVMARNSWERVIGLKEDDWPFAAFLLRHSLQDHPENLNFSPRSRASNLIKDSTEYQDALLNIRKKLTLANEDEVVTGKVPIAFNKGDLYVALHNVTLEYSAQKVGDKWELEIKISDLYDFAHHNAKEVKKFTVRTVNNMAYADQEKGIINNYYVTFNIKESIEEFSVPPSGILLEY